MIEHETRVKVNLSVYINIGTESHPEDIADDMMKEILVSHVTDELKSLDSQSIDLAIDDWEYDDIKVITEEDDD